MPRPTPAHLLSLVIVTLAALAFAACGDGGDSNASLATVRIGELDVRAEVPPPELYAQGLAGRTSLADDAGMLFVFDPPNPAAIWMKGMLISIDILWISPEGEVIHIVEEAAPQGDTPDAELPRFRPDAPAQYVLEIRAGLLHDTGVQLGDHAVVDLPDERASP